jgi:hypothetical protein
MSIRLVLPVPTDFSPEPAPGSNPIRPVPQVPVEGARIVIVNNRWRSMNMLADLLTERLLAGGAREVFHQPALIAEPLADAVLDDLGGRFEAAIVGLGN